MSVRCSCTILLEAVAEQPADWEDLVPEEMPEVQETLDLQETTVVPALEQAQVVLVVLVIQVALAL